MSSIFALYLRLIGSLAFLDITWQYVPSRLKDVKELAYKGLVRVVAQFGTPKVYFFRICMYVSNYE